MNFRTHLNTFLAISLFLLAMMGTAVGQTIYVDVDAAGANDGSSWEDAYNHLQDALSAASSGDEIWVAEGVYKPDQGATVMPGDRTATFQLINSVAVYGGFPPEGGEWEARNSNAYETILSGDLNGDDDGFVNYGENSYHVVTGSGTNGSAILDGFTITGGNADEGWNDDYGGGLYNQAGSPTLTNCTFSDNSASEAGGGIGNVANSNPKLTNCTFSSNFAECGGAMYNQDSSPEVTSCTFCGNFADCGGAMHNRDSSTEVTNCIFSGNSAEYGGGMYNESGSPTLTNCTFYGNSVGMSGGAIRNSSLSNTTVTNCILWSNTPEQISGSAAVTYCDVQGYWPGNGNINDEPLFVDADGDDNVFGTADDNLRLLRGSPCIDAGTNNAPTLPETDFDGNPRVDDGDGDGAAFVDMGAYEVVYVLDLFEGLLVRYDFDSGLSDCSGNDRHGIGGGGQIVSDGKLILDGSANSYVDIPLGAANPFDGHTNYTIGIKFATTSGNGLLLTSGKPNNAVGDHPIMFLALSSHGYLPATPGSLLTDIWYVGSSWSRGGNVNYLDGNMHTATILALDPYNVEFEWYSDGTINSDGATLPHTSYTENISQHIVRIGSADDMSSWIPDVAPDIPGIGNFSGEIDYICIYNRLLTPLEILELPFFIAEPWTPQNPDPPDGADHVDPAAVLSWTTEAANATFDVYFGTSLPPPLVSADQSDASYDPPGDLSMMTDHYWKIDVYDINTDETIEGGEWSFTTGGKAYDPMPPDEAISVSIATDLSWTGDTFAASYDVYFGTSLPPPLVSEAQSNAIYDPPADLAKDTTYYWRIDQRYADGSVMMAGDPWSFTTSRVHYVDAGATGNNDGSSWEDAYKYPQDALANASSGDEFWVAEGIYKPDENTARPSGTGNRRATFQLENGVAFYGGFPSGGGQWQDRNLDAHETILSGDLNGNDGANFTNMNDNSYHVVTGSGTDETAVLDGFTITGGNADETAMEPFGGGMLNWEGSPTLTNCTFRGNSAIGGAGMWNEESNATLTNCTFRENSADYYAGGVCNEYGTPTMTNCTFSGNSASVYWGGGMLNALSSPAVTNCTFSDNWAGDAGGGMWNYVSSNPTLTNCSFIGNSTDNYGGGMDNYIDSSPTLVNCIFRGNSAGRNGGGMSNRDDSSPTLTNCLFSDNLADIGAGISSENNSNITLSNCTIADNIAADIGGADTSNYSSFPISHNLRDIRYTGTSVSLWDDQVSSRISLPFNFDFYGTEYSGIYISSNGFITFLSGQSNGCCSGRPLPTPGNPDGLVAAFWEDINPPQGGRIRYQTLGTVGSREFVVGFYNVPHFYDDYPVTFEIILHEGTNNIELQYGSAPSDGGTHSVGIENHNGTKGLQVAYGNVSFNNEGFLISLGDSFVGGGIYSSNSNTTLTNCILWGNTPDEISVPTGTPVITYSDVQGGWPGEGNIDEDPYFVEPEYLWPVAYWKLDDYTGTTAYDSFGDNDGTIYGAQWTTGQINGALSFDGADDVVTTLLNIDQSSSSTGVTFSAWVYPTSNSTGRHHVISSDNGGFDWSLLRKGDAWYVFTGENSRGTGFSLDMNAWQHVAAVFIPGTGIRFYKNSVGVTMPDIAYDESDNNITIGDNPGHWDEFFAGIIDDVHIYDRALPAEEIQKHYENGLSGHCYPVMTSADYHLLTGSPCIDRGNNTAVPPDTTDPDGNPRIVDGDDDGNPVVDMGAYEYRSPLIFYVDASANGLNDGSSWADAFNYLQDALGACLFGDQIWVAQGIYKPDVDTPHPGGTGSRSATFQLINGVPIYGGYAGFGQPEPNERDPNIYETILSGDLNGDDGPGFANNSENSYHVVTGSNTDTSTILDGFTITAGNANVSGNPTDDGGGIYNSGGSPTLLHCTIYQNWANDSGGGMYNDSDSNPTLTNCIFSGNSAYRGGGVTNRNGSNTTLANCTFSGNAVGENGGGMYNSNSSPTLTNCMFSSNSASDDGGGMYNRGEEEGTCNPILTNCAFSDNSADEEGGGMYNHGYHGECNPILMNCLFSGNSAADEDGGGLRNYDSSPMLTNCTFSSNRASDDGGGIANGRDSSPTLTNCILWGNTPDEISVSTGTPVITYSDIQGGWPGQGNIDADPLFLDADGADDIPGTADDNLNLSVGSPCIDTGDNNSVPADVTDLDGNPRIVDGDRDTDPVIDMGVFEYLNTAPVADAGSNQVAYARLDGIAEVVLDGNDSYDPDGDELTYLWSWTIGYNTYNTNSVSTTIELPIGTHTVQLIVNDGFVDSEPDEAVITVVEPMEVPMKFTPQALNLRSKGKWVKAHFVLPEGFTIDDVDADTPAVIEPLGIESEYMNVFINENGLVEIEAAFSRADFCHSAISDDITDVTVAGLLSTGRYFYGTDTIKIINKSLEYLAIFASYWLQTDCSKPDWCDGLDVNQDSVINFIDFAMSDNCCFEVIKQ